ncbi:Armadillo repeat-containing protein 6 homolog [Eumeta japonica]|uniref:Armadillo repeat-containing protein 6 homolog n=1 Tax=Eumeta variegata TaxID=151549 RepID=A0A4C1ZR76_EUMVA|nr:Armadillo repeat-containing protein 6 homolog [Eumeta japonica]
MCNGLNVIFSVTALAGDDDVKRQLVRGGMAPLAVSVLRRHASNVNLAAAALKCIAALALREPAHSAALGDAGAPDAILTAMKIHSDVASVQPCGSRFFEDSIISDAPSTKPASLPACTMTSGRLWIQKNACWAIRNMVARCRDQNAKFHELGAQEILDAAYRRFSKEFGFDIRSALRDLDCDVKLEEQWTGSGVQLANE